MEYVLVENTWKRDPSFGGWGNGYIAIPEGHPWHGIEYDEIPIAGLTYSQYAEENKHSKMNNKIKHNDWLIGFDTFRSYESNLTKEDVKQRTLEIIKELEELAPVAKTKSFAYCPVCRFPKDISDVPEYFGKETHKTECFMCSSEYYYSI